MLAGVILLAHLDRAPTCRTADSRLERLIAATAEEERATEYCQARLYHTIDDLDGDGREDFIVVFEVEAVMGNNSVQYLAVLPSGTSWHPSVMKVGERGQRFIDGIDVEDGRTVVLETSEYRKGDATCCPSADGELRFTLIDGHIVSASNAPPNDGMLKRSAPSRRRGPRT
jgi:hypothetical protein